MKKGDRVRYSAYYLRTRPQTKASKPDRLGTVAGFAFDKRYAYVMWDGRVSADTVGLDYLEKEFPDPAPQDVCEQDTMAL